jgi:hypothetical protein
MCEENWIESGPGRPNNGRNVPTRARANFADKALSFWVTASGHFALFS